MSASEREVDYAVLGDADSGRSRPLGESRSDAVGVEIRRAIVDGRLRPGDKLGEVALAKSLGVSRPTVREAFVGLARQGLVLQEPYRGFRVGAVSDQQLKDIAVTRVGLDMIAIDCILADDTDRRIGRVRAGWHVFERRAFSTDVVELHEAHIAFHRSIWLASENSLLIDLWPVTASHMTLALAQDQRDRDDPGRAHRLHERLMDAIETRDRDTIHAAFVEHTLGSVDELIDLHRERRQGD